jgi:hypothetical protein
MVRQALCARRGLLCGEASFLPQRNFVTSEPGALAKLLAIPVFFLAGMAVTVLVRPLRERPRVALAWWSNVFC